MRRTLGVIALSLLLSCHLMNAAPAAWAAGNAQTGVTYADGMLSVSVNNVTLGSLLDDIAAKAKITVHIADEVKGVRVSSRYTALPLKDGLVRILEEAGLNSYLLVYGDREQRTVSQLFVMKGEKTPGSAAPSSGRTTDRAPGRPEEMPGTRLSPPVPPMVPVPMPPPVSEEFPEPPPPPFPPVPEQEEMPPAVPPPLPPVDMDEVPPPAPPVLP